MHVQWKGALRIVSPHGTVSESAVFMIAGVIPVHLLTRDRLPVYRQAIYSQILEADKAIVTSEECEHTLTEWQATWESKSCGRWTKRLIPSVCQSIERKYGELGYYVTQLFSRHGYIPKLLHKIKKRDSP